MKKYHISSGYIDRVIRTIEHNCFQNPNGAFCGAELSEFCCNPKNLYTLHLLEASEDIRMSVPNNSEIPFAIWLENKGFLHSYTKHEKRKSAFKGFIAGLFSGVLITVLSQLLLSFITTTFFQ